MDVLKLISTVNAGVSLEFGGKRIWVDAIHDYKTRDFSTCTPEITERLMTDPRLSEPDFMLFTHTHPDHCSPKLVNECLCLWPDTRVLAPEKQDIFKTEISSVTVTEHDVDEYFFDGLHITFFRLTHDNVRFKDTPHRGILLEYGDKTLLFPGDTSVKSDELFAFLEKRPVAGGKIFAVFLNFPWLCLSLGREKIQKLGASHTVFLHIPLEQDDNWGYRKQFFKILDENREGRDFTALGETFTEKIFN